MTYFVSKLFWLSTLVPGSLETQSSTVQVHLDSILTVSHTKDFKITGDGSSVNWNFAKWVKMPQRNSDGAVYQTQVKILYSTSGIYCLFKCEDSKITSSLKADFLDLWKEDVVEVFFWTDESVSIYFEYELSPMNYELPILVPNINGAAFGWRPWRYEGERKIRHATHVNREKNKRDAIISWTAEFFIPFALLKPLANVPPKKGTRWRANFYRLDYDKGRSSWSWQETRKNFHDYERFGTLLFE